MTSRCSRERARKHTHKHRTSVSTDSKGVLVASPVGDERFISSVVDGVLLAVGWNAQQLRLFRKMTSMNSVGGGNTCSSAECAEVETMKNSTKALNDGHLPQFMGDYSSPLDITAVRVIIIALYGTVFVTCLTGGSKMMLVISNK